jgi:hypothetical protein
MDINCPHFGWVKVKFSDLDFYYWEECRDKGMEITIKCVCGESHEILK